MNKTKIILGCIFCLNFFFGKSIADTTPVSEKSQELNVSKKNLEIARNFFETQQYEKALFFYYKQLEIEPNNTDLLIEIARVENISKNYEKSVQLLNKVIKIAPQRRFDVLRPLAWGYYGINQPDQAMVYFREYLKKYPKDSAALDGLDTVLLDKKNEYLKISKKYYEKKQYNLSEFYIKKAIEMQPKNSGLYMELAEIYIITHEHQKAVNALEKVIEVAPQRRLGLLPRLAWEYQSLGKPKKAQELFLEYLAVMPDNKEAKRGLKIVSQQILDAESKPDNSEKNTALMNYQNSEKKLENDPKNIGLIIQTARDADKLGYHNEALELMNNAIAISPKIQDDYTPFIAWQYFNIGQEDKARSMLKNYLIAHPDNIEAKKYQILITSAWMQYNPSLKQARLYIKNKNYHKALPLYEALLQKNPDNVDLLIETAQLNDNLKNYQTAIQLLEKAIQIEPNRRDGITVLLAWEYANVNQTDKATFLLKDHIKKYPNDQEAKNALRIITANNPQLALAEHFMKRRKYDEAIKIYETQLAKEPDNAELMILMAKANDDRKNYQQSLYWLEKAVQTSPNKRNELTVLMAWQYAHLKQNDKARSLLNDYLAKYPHDQEAEKALSIITAQNPAFIEAEKLEKQGKYDEAIQIYETELAKDPENTALMIRIGKAYDNSKNHSKSLYWFEKAARVSPETRYELTVLIAWQYANLHENDKAKSLLKNYLIKYPHDREAQRALVNISAEKFASNPALDKANALSEQGKYTQAIQIYQSEYQKDPRNTEIMILLAKANDNIKNYPEALAWLQKVVEVAPERRDEITLLIAWEYANLQQNKKAIQILQDYIKRHPEDKEARKALAMITGQYEVVDPELQRARDLAQRKNYAAALALYQQLLRRDPRDVELLIEMAKLNDSAGNYRQTIQLLERVQQIQPSKRDAILPLLAWQYANLNDNKTAIKLFEEYIQKHPGDKNVLLDLAQINSWNESYYRAMFLYKKVASEDPENIRAQLGMADTYLNLKQYGLAQKKYAVLVAKYPRNKQIRERMANFYKDAGFYRKALWEYNNLLREYPADPDIKVSLAYVQYWAGYDDLALKTLDSVNTKDAVALKGKLKSDLSDGIAADYDHSLDTDGVLINSGIASYQYHLPNHMTIITPSYRRASVKQYGIDLPANLGMLMISDRFGSIDGPMGTIWPSVGIGIRNYENMGFRFIDFEDGNALFSATDNDSWNTVAWTANLKWIPFDLLKIYVASNNQTVENIIALENRVLYSSVSAGFDYNFYPPVVFTLEGSVGQFDDGNTRSGAATRIAIDIWGNSGLNIGFAGLAYNDSNPDIYRGYYNPAKYWQGVGFVGFNTSMFSFDWNADMQLGKYQEVPGGTGDLYGFTGGVGRTLGRWGYISAYYSQSQSSPVGRNPFGGYGVKAWGINYDFNFDGGIISSETQPFTFVNNRGAR